MKKIYVLDTNVILDNPDCLINSFDDNDLVIPLIVIEELDNLKKNNNDVGYNARQALRNIEAIRKDQNISKWVSRTPYSSLKVVHLNGEECKEYEKQGFKLAKNDDYIICVSFKVKADTEVPVILISNDVTVRIKASLLDIPAQLYKEGTVPKETFNYTGYRNVEIPLTFYEQFERVPLKIEKEELAEYFNVDSLLANEYVLLSPKDDENNLSKKDKKRLKDVYRFDGQKLAKKSLTNKDLYGGVSGKNLEQSIAIDMLLDDDITVLAMVGIAGSGKNFLSISTFLSKVLKEKESKYEKIILLKPTIPVSDDIGFLPGGMEEKVNSYMGSFHDNFKTLRKMESMRTKSSLDTFEQLKEKGKIEIDCISFLRGRSLNDCLIIVDEVQNITQIVIKTILTRVGENCKIVLLGDPDQIDRNYLSKYNNGLSYAVDKLKGQNFFGYIKFIQGVRSNVSKICAELL